MHAHFVAASYTHATLPRIAATKRRTVGKFARNIVLGVLAGIAVLYGEYRAIQQAPSFAVACLVALSSDFEGILDMNPAVRSGDLSRSPR